MRRHIISQGFTLTELAVVLAIVGLLLGMGMYTLSAQVNQRSHDDTQRRLVEARELLYGFAVVNGRLPCPAAPNTNGDESPPAGGACTNPYDGFLPARALGFQPTDSAGYAVDSWGNRIRYAVSTTTWSGSMRFTTKGTTAMPWSLSTTPTDLVICSASPATVTNTTCDAGTAVTNQNIVVALVLSTGKNTTTTGGSGTHEARNLDNNALFVHRPPQPTGSAGGEFDDQMTWIPVGALYNRMVSAGLLP